MLRLSKKMSPRMERRSSLRRTVRNWGQSVANTMASAPAAARMASGISLMSGTSGTAVTMGSYAATNAPFPMVRIVARPV